MVSRDEDEHERRRQQIIDGALVVFAEKGFEKATNQDIAEAAGIGSPGLIYHYFESKADLLRQVVASRSLGLQERPGRRGVGCASAARGPVAHRFGVSEPGK